jgi:anti-sigma regulatory factor (Ser/Thr protein kinase)
MSEIIVRDPQPLDLPDDRHSLPTLLPRTLGPGEFVLARHWLRWLLIFGLWTLLGLFEAGQTYFLSELLYEPGRKKLSLEQCLLLSLGIWYGLAVLSPLLIALARYFPFEPRKWKSRLAILLTATTVLSLLKVGLDVPLEKLVRAEYPWMEEKDNFQLFYIFFNARFVNYMLVFWAVLGITQTLDYYRKFRDRELRASQLEAQLAQAQLQVLKMQLQPHFLFNTLHAISALMHQNVDIADRMLARLGELLRATLESAGTHCVPLWQELEFIKPYLEIEQARLGPRLAVRLDVDPDASAALVPNLILQPLVENAIRHGIGPRPGGGRIEIRANRNDGRLSLQVSDNGRGLSANYREGVGVTNTRARLHKLYATTGHRFTLENRVEGGVTVTVDLPFEEAADSEVYTSTGGNGDSNPYPYSR